MAEDEKVALGEQAEGPDSAVAVKSPSDAAEGAGGEVKIPEFAEVSERVVKRLDSHPDRLHSVSVAVWAELGRVEMLIGDLLQLGEGSVVRLDRSVGEPVDLISQGVKLARGEVIVVEDSFAIRIREILSGE